MPGSKGRIVAPYFIHSGNRKTTMSSIGRAAPVGQLFGQETQSSQDSSQLRRPFGEPAVRCLVKLGCGPVLSYAINPSQSGRGQLVRPSCVRASSPPSRGQPKTTNGPNSLTRMLPVSRRWTSQCGNIRSNSPLHLLYYRTDVLRKYTLGRSDPPKLPVESLSGRHPVRNVSRRCIECGDKILSSWHAACRTESPFSNFQISSTAHSGHFDENAPISLIPAERSCPTGKDAPVEPLVTNSARYWRTYNFRHGGPKF